MIEEKGIETAIHALSLLPLNATLEIVGMVDPPYQHHLEALGVASRLSFSLASRRQVRQHYQQGDNQKTLTKVTKESTLSGR